ncbi:hypothetical protein PENSTE_c002G01704 [Penicillium steckii]|uniref:Uncharacterized protein n=1 Tax=Penicillium steckii TaxID=303698 RepID=A0A1V6TUE7_9EURO|nr:hypothetical protein PENSTE_c002G01704 [Penicillium steckii]
MHSFRQITIGSLLSLSICSTASSTADLTIQNANHIFNVIHDSMRQWGSSLHHNGVSFFLATVPAGTQFYHGTSNPGIVSGMEWLAFEPEHAMVFARPHRGPPPPGPPDDNDKDDRNGHHEELRRRHDEGPPQPPPDFKDFDENDSGYLHTYAAAKDLRLIYIDGMSAGKTNKGTLDSQDYVLFNGTIENFSKDKKPHRGPGGEYDRANKACEMAKNEWEGSIDGVLRMEAGFEIILCSFERDLTPIRTTQVKKDTKARGKGKGGPKPHGTPGGDKKRKGPGPGGHGPDSSRWMRAVTSRYDSIGGNRVSLNYDNFVTAFSHDFNLFPEESILPRLAHLSSLNWTALRSEITSMVLSQDSKSSWDWQATADMIVTRYSDELSSMASEKFADLKQLHEHIEILLSPFIDYSKRDIQEEAERCSTQFLPFQAQDEKSLAARSLHHVAHTICSTLLEAWAEEKLSLSQNRVRSLITYLDWTTWKECRGCQDNEICVVPIWPMGTISDYDNPKCRDASRPYDGEDGESYWGGMHG